MLGALEDLAPIGTLAFEYRARIMQAVGTDVKRSIAPRLKLAVVPDYSIETVIWLVRHDASSVRPGFERPAPIIGCGRTLCVRRRHPLLFERPMRARFEASAQRRALSPAILSREPKGRITICPKYVNMADLTV